MKKYFYFSLTAFLLLFVAYFIFVYYVPYSNGVRAGELIKMSKKGVLIKTWEGELSQGISGAQIFKFSVLDSDTAVIDALIENQGKQVKLTYMERYLTFPWWGDTKYFVTAIELEN